MAVMSPSLTMNPKPYNIVGSGKLTGEWVGRIFPHYARSKTTVLCKTVSYVLTLKYYGKALRVNSNDERATIMRHWNDLDTMVNQKYNEYIQNSFTNISVNPKCSLWNFTFQNQV